MKTMRRVPSLLLVVLLVIAGLTGVSFARSSYLNQFNTRYGTAATALNTCNLCHIPPGQNLNFNPFGSAFFAAGGDADPGGALGAIEGSDSDGDTFSNVSEITARTFPGDPNSRPAVADITAPTVQAFVIPATATSLTIPITTLTATDDIAVTGLMVTQSPAAPAANDPNWSGTPPTTFTFPQGTVPGLKDLFAWAKDAAGNVSPSRQQTVDLIITLTTFADVPETHFAFAQVEAVAAQGITGGCREDDPLTPANEALFCPDVALTRSQMAVFVETSLGVTSALLPPCAGTVFNDVTVASVGEVVCRFIEDFAASGISGGCQQDNPATPGVNEARFCPNDTVTRAQMAVFIEASLGVSPVPACLGTVFNDVTAAGLGSAFCGLIEDFAAQGIAAGCQADNPATPAVNEAMYCPNNPVTRAQMAVFIVAAPAPLLP